MGDQPLVGRTSELAALDAIVTRARGGHGCVVVLRGEAGIGKSALARIATDRAEAAGFVVTLGRAWEGGEAPPYVPIWPLLRHLGLERPGHTVADVPEASAFQLWDDVLEALARKSDGAPQLFVLEDLHAADAATLALLAYLAQPLQALPVVVLVTARTADPALDARKAALLTRIARAGVEVIVPPLAREAVASLFAARRGRTPSDTEVDRVVELSGGVPFFVGEALATSDAAQKTSRGLRESVASQVERLPASTRRALDACAVLGREVRVGTAAEMVALLPARVIDDLADAVAAGILTEEAPGRFSFRHALVRDALYERLGPIARAALHHAAARALVQGGAADALARVTHRVLAAGHAPLTDGEVTEVLDVAGSLEADGAFDRALRLLERLLDTLPPEHGERLPTTLRAAAAAQHAGLYAAGQRNARAAYLLARTLGRGDDVGRAALLLGGELRPGVVDAALVTALDEASRVVRDPGLLCIVRARLAAARQPAADPNGPIELARSALADARRLGDVVTLREVVHLAGSACTDYAPLAEQRALDEELLALSLETGDMPKALRAVTRLTISSLEAGDLASLGPRVDELLALADALGHPRFQWRALLMASMRALSAGRIDESAGYVREVRLAATATDDPALPLTLPIHELMRAYLVGTDAEMSAAVLGIEPGLAHAPFSDAIGCAIRAAVHARRGDVAATAHELATARLDSPPLRFDPFLLAMFAHGVAFAGDVRLVRLVRDRLAPLVRREITSGHVGITYHGPSDRLLALLDARLGLATDAERRLAEHQRRADEHGQPTWVAQLAWDRCWVLDQAGDVGGAAARRADAARLAAAAGLDWLVARTTSVDAPAPLAAPAPTARPRFGLAREGDTWRVSFEGRSLTLRDGRGVHMLARLVERPDQDVHVLALAGGADDGGDAGTHLDTRALAAYRERLRTLRADIDEAEGRHDVGRLEALRHEREALESEISRAVGLGGRLRRAGSASQRARVNVQRRLKDVVSQLSALDPALGAYLERALRTGTFCCFRP